MLWRAKQLDPASNGMPTRRPGGLQPNTAVGRMMVHLSVLILAPLAQNCVLSRGTCAVPRHPETVPGPGRTVCLHQPSALQSRCCRRSVTAGSNSITSVRLFRTCPLSVDPSPGHRHLQDLWHGVWPPSHPRMITRSCGSQVRRARQLLQEDRHEDRLRQSGYGYDSANHEGGL